MELSPLKPIKIGSKYIKTVRVDPRSLLKIAIEHSNYKGMSKWGGVPVDSQLLSLQRKAASDGLFHIIRLHCGTMHPESLPLDPQTQKPAENLYLFSPTQGEKELMQEVHHKG